MQLTAVETPAERWPLGEKAVRPLLLVTWYTVGKSTEDNKVSSSVCRRYSTVSKSDSGIGHRAWGPQGSSAVPAL